MEQPKKELIKEIADLFEDYEEAYVPGEWENFQQSRKKKYPFLPMWLKAAAVLLLVSGVAVFSLRNNFKDQSLSAVVKPKAANTGSSTNTGSAKNPSAPITGTDSSQNQAAQAYTGTASVPSGVAAAKPADFNSVRGTQSSVPGLRSGAMITAKAGTDPQQLMPVPTTQVSPVQVKEKDAVTPVISGALANRPVQKESQDTVAVKKEKLSTSDFLLAETRKAEVREKVKPLIAESKWDFGVQVMPSATHSTTKVGAGLVTAYRISNRLSLSSGISLLQLGSAGNTPGASGADMAMSNPSVGPANAENVAGFTTTDKRLLTIQANISAIDIPLGLVYKLNKHYYTSAGISYFNVISEKRNNTYSQLSPVDKTSTNPSTGAVSVYRAFQTMEVAEPAAEKPLKGNSYLGFINFSVGRRQNIFNQYSIQIEPFIKIPVGRLSTQELNLLNSGVKFQLSF